MARLLGPDMGSRVAFLPNGAAAAFRSRPVYSDAAATQLADIRTFDGSNVPGAVIAGSVLTADAFGLYELFWFPDGDPVGPSRLYVRVAGGGVVPIDADNNARVDALATRVGTVEGDIGGLAVTSTQVDAAWPGWAEQIVALGFTPATDRTFQRVNGVFETDAMLSVRGGHGRWGGTHPYGSHVFEAWNKAATNRLTMLVGLNATDEAALFVTAPLSSTWGKVRVGTDTWNRGTLFGRDAVEFFEAAAFHNTVQFDATAQFNARATFAAGLTLATDQGMSAAGNTGGIEVGGGSLTGFNQRNGAALALRGDQHPSSPGTATLYLGSYAQAIASTASLNVDWIAGPATSPVSVFSVRGDGLVSVITGRLRLATSLPPSSATGGGSSGLIAWDAGFIYVCTGTNTWKRAALTTW